MTMEIRSRSNPVPPGDPGGTLLKKAFDAKCKAGTSFNWMLAKKRIPVYMLEQMIRDMEEAIELLKKIKN